MKKYLIVRLTKAVLTVWFIVSLVFVLTRISGDPTQWMLPDDASIETRLELRQSLGLDRPVAEQYRDYIGDVFQGDMGKSYYYLKPVGELFTERAAATLKLAVVSFSLAILIGVPLGVLAAVHRNTFLDRLTMGFAIAGYTIPNFVLGILLIFLFSLKMRILPSGGYGEGANYVMPVLALMVGPMANIARLTRSSMLDVLRQDYLDCARAKGVVETKVIFKHALRNALIPVVTIIGLQIGTLIGGMVVVETVFAWPGIGSLIISSAQNRDFPVVQYGIMICAIIVCVTNLLVDLSYAWLDPRIRDNF